MSSKLKTPLKIVVGLGLWLIVGLWLNYQTIPGWAERAVYARPVELIILVAGFSAGAASLYEAITGRSVWS